MKKIEINFPYEKVLKRKERWERVTNFKQPDQIPFLPYIGSRYLLPILGYDGRFLEYFKNPKIMLEAQMSGIKWLFENINSDFHKIVLTPDFMWIEDIESFGATINYSNNDSPWLERPHILKDYKDIEKVKKVDYVYNGLHGKSFYFYKKMQEISSDYEFVFKDGKTIPASNCVYMNGSGIIGLFALANDLRGIESLSIDLYDNPEFVKELLDLIVNKSIEWINEARKVSKGKVSFANDFHDEVVFIGDDGLTQLSPKQVIEFALQPLKKLADYFHSKGLKIMAHNCSKADHILKYWVEDVKIDRYFGFSYLTDKGLIKNLMMNKVILIGGLNPLILHSGTPEEVKLDVYENIKNFKECPGFILMDGNNIAPGTPVENINTVSEAINLYGEF